jgi:DNA-binding MarR family transcriptional regulator
MNAWPRMALMNDGPNAPGDTQADRLLRLVHWTGAASRHLRRRLAEVAAGFDLSDSELLVVWLCNGGGRVQIELAGLIGISPAQMSGMVERLRARDLVAMHRLAMDRRRQVWRMTTAGQALLSQAARRLEEQTIELAGDLSHRELDAMQVLCERLTQNDAHPRRNSQPGTSDREAARECREAA